jgi:PAS domain S-box-containing protein
LGEIVRLADASAEQIKLIEELLMETKEMWQRIRDLEKSLENCQAMVDSQKIAISRYRTAFKQLPCGVYVKDADMKYLFCNDAYARMINMRLEDVPGKADRELFSQEKAVKLLAGEKQVWHSGRVMESEEKHLVIGEERTFLVARRLFRGDEGDVPHLLGILVDITERKRQEEQLEQLSLACSLQNESLMIEVEQAHAAAKQQEDNIRTLRTDLEKHISLRDVELEGLKSRLRQHLAKIANLQSLVDSTKKYLDSLEEST